jgi:hypothetical protein
MKDLDTAAPAREVSSHTNGGIEVMGKDGRYKDVNSHTAPDAACGKSSRPPLTVSRCTPETQQVALPLRQAANACARPRTAVCGVTREDLDQHG